jgi:hypothetical protein
MNADRVDMGRISGENAEMQARLSKEQGGFGRGELNEFARLLEGVCESARGLAHSRTLRAQGEKGFAD